MWRRPFSTLFAIIAAVALLLPVDASARPFPDIAKRGKMTPAAFPEIVIDGASRQLAPGARIWGDNNLIQMPASLRGNDFPVNYTEDGQGQIDRVWILTVEEASESIAQQTQQKQQTNSQPQ